MDQEYIKTLLFRRDKASTDFAKQLDTAWKKSYKDEADLEAQNPGLTKKIWANLKQILVLPESKDLLAAFMACDFAPPKFKEEIKKLVHEQQSIDAAKQARKDAAKLVKKETKGFTAGKSQAKTGDKFSVSQTQKGVVYGATIDPKTGSITHFQKTPDPSDPSKSCFSSVTYFVEEGRAVVVRQTKGGKALGKGQVCTLEGLSGPTPTLAGKLLSDAAARRWTSAFAQYDALYKSAKEHGFTSLRGTLNVKSQASLFNDSAFKTR